MFTGALSFWKLMEWCWEKEAGHDLEEDLIEYTVVEGTAPNPAFLPGSLSSSPPSCTVPTLLLIKEVILHL